MEAPMDLAAKLAVEEQRAKQDPATVHSRNMVEKPAQAHLANHRNCLTHRILALQKNNDARRVSQDVWMFADFDNNILLQSDPHLAGIHIFPSPKQSNSVVVLQEKIGVAEQIYGQFLTNIQPLRKIFDKFNRPQVDEEFKVFKCSTI